jgi:hypothetical protein
MPPAPRPAPRSCAVDSHASILAPPNIAPHPAATTTFVPPLIFLALPLKLGCQGPEGEFAHCHLLLQLLYQDHGGNGIGAGGRFVVVRTTVCCLAFTLVACCNHPAARQWMTTIFGHGDIHLHLPPPPHLPPPCRPRYRPRTHWADCNQRRCHRQMRCGRELSNCRRPGTATDAIWKGSGREANTAMCCGVPSSTSSSSLPHSVMMPFVPPQHKAQRPPDQMMQHASPKASILVVVAIVAVLPISSPPLDLVPLMPPGIGRSVDNVPYFPVFVTCPCEVMQVLQLHALRQVDAKSPHQELPQVGDHVEQSVLHVAIADVLVRPGDERGNDTVNGTIVQVFGQIQSFVSNVAAIFVMLLRLHRHCKDRIDIAKIACYGKKILSATKYCPQADLLETTTHKQKNSEKHASGSTMLPQSLCRRRTLCHHCWVRRRYCLAGITKLGE